MSQIENDHFEYRRWIGVDDETGERYEETEASTKAECNRWIRELFDPCDGISAVHFKITKTVEPIPARVKQ